MALRISKDNLAHLLVPTHLDMNTPPHSLANPVPRVEANLPESIQVSEVGMFRESLTSPVAHPRDYDDLLLST